MPDNYISKIDFGDGILRTIKADGGGGSGLYIGDVSNFTATSSMGVQKITLTWNDPDDIYIAGVLQASWGGTKIVRKEGSVPATIADGTIIVDNTVRNQYSSVGFEDNAITLDTVYYYRAFTYTTNNTYTDGSYVSDEAQSLKVYGVEWDGTASSAWTRTDGAAEFEDPIPYYPGIESTPSSPFDSVLPWSGMQVVEDAEAGTLVSIPKFYYKWTKNENAIKLQVSVIALEGFSVSPAHMDRGDGQGERDVVYVARYNCKKNTLESATGSELYYSGTTINEARRIISAKGAEIWQWDYAMYWTICMLYLVEYADWDVESKIGAGAGGHGNTGGTDQMPYHTGSMAIPSTGGDIQYRYIENLWRVDLDTYCDGIIPKTRIDYTSRTYKIGIYIIINPTNFTNDTTTNAVFIGDAIEYNGFIKAFNIPEENGYEWALYVSDAYQSSSATYNNYVKDYYTSYSAQSYPYSGPNTLVICGGGFKGRSGLFSRDNTIVSSSSGSKVARLMKLPNNT